MFLRRKRVLTQTYREKKRGGWGWRELREGGEAGTNTDNQLNRRFIYSRHFSILASRWLKCPCTCVGNQHPPVVTSNMIYIDMMAQYPATDKVTGSYVPYAGADSTLK